MNDSFPFLWPIKVARVVVTLFVSMFYIASLNIFLMACACNKHDGHWIHLVFGVGRFTSRASTCRNSKVSNGKSAKEPEQLISFCLCKRTMSPAISVVAGHLCTTATAGDG